MMQVSPSLGSRFASRRVSGFWEWKFYRNRDQPWPDRMWICGRSSCRRIYSNTTHGQYKYGDNWEKCWIEDSAVIRWQWAWSCGLSPKFLICGMKIVMPAFSKSLSSICSVLSNNSLLVANSCKKMGLLIKAARKDWARWRGIIIHLPMFGFLREWNQLSKLSGFLSANLMHVFANFTFPAAYFPLSGTLSWRVFHRTQFGKCNLKAEKEETLKVCACLLSSMSDSVLLMILTLHRVNRVSFLKVFWSNLAGSTM